MTYPTDPPQPTGEYPAPYQVPAVHTPKKHPLRRHLLFITTPVALVMFGIGAATGAAGGSDPSLTAAPAPTTTVTVAPEFPVLSAAPAATVKPTATPKPAPVKAMIPDGYSADIPGDVPAGKYKAHSDSSDCFWNIEKTGGVDDIVDNGGYIKGTLTVTLRKGETFESHDCGDWTQQ